MKDEISSVDRVAFRAFRDKNNDVIALLPDSEANPGRILSYMHIGQHGEAEYPSIIQRTRPAKEEEYKDLLEELKTIGYNPIIIERITEVNNIPQHHLDNIGMGR